MPSGSVACDVVCGVEYVVINVVIVVICCCHDACVSGDLLVRIKSMVMYMLLWPIGVMVGMMLFLLWLWFIMLLWMLLSCLTWWDVCVCMNWE